MRRTNTPTPCASGPPRRAAGNQAGFTLLELIIVMSVLALIMGAITPAMGTMIRSKARTGTLGELERLGQAALDHYADTGAYPSDATGLLASSVSGWAGPYLAGTTDDPWSGRSGYQVDGYGEVYDFASSGVQLTITSAGPDRSASTGDDIALVIDATPVLRRRTLDRMSTVNVAITQYNAVYLSTEPLPATWSAAYAQLVSRGYLPLGGPEEEDAFGAAFVGDPSASPLVRVTSSNL